MSIVQLYHGENKLLFDKMINMSALYYTNRLSWILIVLADWYNSLHVATLWQLFLSQRQSVIVLTHMVSRESENLNLIVFGFTRPGVKGKMNFTPGDRFNHYTTEAVFQKIWYFLNVFFLILHAFETLFLMFSKLLNVYILIKIETKLSCEKETQKKICKEDTNASLPANENRIITPDQKKC